MKLKKYIKKNSIICLCLFLLVGEAYSFTILVDPGHGGKELGAIGYIKKNHRNVKIYEKDLSLTLAKEIHRVLKRKYSSYLTRSYDRTVSLEERAAMAEKVKADLVISVHINSHHKSTASGFETYYLDNHDSGAVQKIEKIENKGLAGNDLVVNQILIDLVVQKTVKTSKPLASLIHLNLKKKIEKKYKMKDRHIKPGLFFVLALSKRPGVLLEAGFISNAKDLKNMLNKDFQKRYALAVFNAIKSYLKKNKPNKPSLF
jgi:N-acetylmuramoyl-L-alanine amidase